MFKKMKHMKNEKGLTLIELLAVIVILAIIAAIAIPAIGNIINNQRDKAILSDVSSLVSAAKLAYADGACIDDVCTYTTSTTTNEVSFSSTKIASGATVTFSATAVPSIEFDLISPAAFKTGGKVLTALGAKPATGGWVLNETELNNILDKGTK